MLDRLFDPAILVMNKLPFTLKFALVCALFAVPLLFTTAQTVSSRQYAIDAVNKERQGALLASELHDAIIELEQLRDLSVTHRISRDPKLAQMFEDSLQKSRSLLESYAESKTDRQSQLINLSANDIKFALDNFRVNTGSEGDSAFNIFDKVNSIVNEAYTLQLQVFNEHGLLSGRDLLASQIASIITKDLQQPMESLGEARAFGTYFLSAGVMGSQGISTLENTYKQLINLERRLNQRFLILLQTQPQLLDKTNIDTTVLDSMGRTARLVEDKLLLAPELDTAWNQFYTESTASIERINALKKNLLSFLSLHYEVSRETLYRDRYLHAAGITALIILFAYLFIGFYKAIKQSLNKLSGAAMAVAEGELNQKVFIDARDELGELANVLDKMRKQLQVREKQLVELTITDGLTGVRNRKYFNDRLKEQIELCKRSSKPISLLVIDIDHFKSINDTYGHQAGDRCLIEVAQALRISLERVTDEVSRFGGEEFAVFLPSTDLDGAKIVAEQLCNCIRKLCVRYNDQDIKMTISIGVSSSETIDKPTEDNILRLADKALYCAKKGGRDRWEVAIKDERV